MDCNGWDFYTTNNIHHTITSVFFVSLNLFYNHYIIQGNDTPINRLKIYGKKLNSVMNVTFLHISNLTSSVHHIMFIYFPVIFRGSTQSIHWKYSEHNQRSNNDEISK